MVKYKLFKRSLEDGETKTSCHTFVVGGCMDDVLGTNLISDDDVILTDHPKRGDVGIIALEETADGKTLGRIGVFAGKEETTGRGLVLSTNRGVGHRRKEAFEMTTDVGGKAGRMKVVGTLPIDDLLRLEEDIRYGGKENEPL